MSSLLAQSNDLGATDTCGAHGRPRQWPRPLAAGPNMSPGLEPTSPQRSAPNRTTTAPDRTIMNARVADIGGACCSPNAGLRARLCGLPLVPVHGSIWKGRRELCGIPDRCRREPARRRSDSPVDGVLISHTLCENRTAASALGVVMVGPGRRPRAAVGGPAQLRAGQSLDNMD